MRTPAGARKHMKKGPGCSRGPINERRKHMPVTEQDTRPPIVWPDKARVRRGDATTSHEAADSNDTAASRTFVMFALIEHDMLASFELEQIADGLWSPSRIRTAVSELVERGLVEFAGVYRLTPAGRRAQVWKVRS